MNEKNIRQIRKRHAREIKAFQDKCPHKNISDFIEEWWAPGHSTGQQVKVCRVCDKIVEREE